MELQPTISTRHLSPLALIPATIFVVLGASLALAKPTSTAPHRVTRTAAAMTFTPAVRADGAEGKATGQNEPQVTVDQGGRTYVDWQSSPKGVAAASTKDGVHFSYLGNPDNATAEVGDVVWATTTWPRVGAVSPVNSRGDDGVFFGTLGSGTCGAIEIRESTSIDQGRHWSPTDASCQPAQVDRDWFAAYTPKRYRGTNQARAHTWIYAEYHDFGASMIWVVRSSDGGATWDKVQHPAIQPGSAAAQVAASLTSTCNTIPSGVAVDQNGAHRGRVYVIWETSDVTQNGEGCNYTQAQAFDHIFISYSDDNGVTWTSRPVFNDPCAPSPPVPPSDSARCQDVSELFNSLAVDNAGNVYVAYTFRNLSEKHPEYDIYVSVSRNGGNTWHRYQVTPDGSGTHYMP
ncbi:MAG TPA: sialidase family protein, partial [Chloroflexota bacterium]|nr:sialidase family protein [Chloroflexota bacterium]